MKRNLTTAISLRLGYARTLLGKLIKWTVRAILILMLVIVVSYIVGSYHGVDDNSQLMLVRFGLIVSLLLVISAVYGFLLDLFYTIHRKKATYLIGALGYVLIIALGVLASLGMAFILGAVGGNR